MSLILQCFKHTRQLITSVTSIHVRRCPIHTSTPRQAHPLIKIGALISTRIARRWWNKLPKERQAVLRARFDSLRKYSWLGGGVAVAGAGVYYVSHLEETPITRRRRFVAIDPQLVDEMSREQLHLLLEMFKENVLPASDPGRLRVKRVVGRLLDANKELLASVCDSWSITVVQSPEINAMVNPTGHIIVFSGLIDFAETDDQLAFIIAHEISHVLLQHSREKVSFANVIDWVLIASNAIFPTDMTAAFGYWLQKHILKLLFELPYSRKLETEADHVGLDIMARACFDVRQSCRFWEIMEELEEKQEVDIPKWLSTHPDNGDRASYLKELLPKAIQLREDCNCFKLEPEPVKLLKQGFKLIR